MGLFRRKTGLEDLLRGHHFISKNSRGLDKVSRELTFSKWFGIFDRLLDDIEKYEKKQQDLSAKNNQSPGRYNPYEQLIRFNKRMEQQSREFLTQHMGCILPGHGIDTRRLDSAGLRSSIARYAENKGLGYLLPESFLRNDYHVICFSSPRELPEAPYFDRARSVYNAWEKHMQDRSSSPYKNIDELRKDLGLSRNRFYDMVNYIKLNMQLENRQETKALDDKITAYLEFRDFQKHKLEKKLKLYNAAVEEDKRARDLGVSKSTFKKYARYIENLKDDDSPLGRYVRSRL